uniref:Uncharacterized protein n=1 Tax=Amphimedon queenslandica TaxID=400682 RepID=A0A1X7SMQ8_AMPQE
MGAFFRPRFGAKATFTSPFGFAFGVAFGFEVARLAAGISPHPDHLRNRPDRNRDRRSADLPNDRPRIVGFPQRVIDPPFFLGDGRPNLVDPITRFLPTLIAVTAEDLDHRFYVLG